MRLINWIKSNHRNPVEWVSVIAAAFVLGAVVSHGMIGIVMFVMTILHAAITLYLMMDIAFFTLAAVRCDTNKVFFFLEICLRPYVKHFHKSGALTGIFLSMVLLVILDMLI